MLLKDRLKELRIERDLLQKDIAKILNLTTSAYGYYEQGKRVPDSETIKILSAFYSVSSDYLLGISDILLIDQPELSLHQKVALKFADQLTKDGYELEENDLNDLLLVSKFTLEQKKNKK